MMKSELIFVPLPAAGHLTSALQLAKLLVSRDDELSIRILVFKDGTANSRIQSLYTETTKGVQFTELPEPQPEDYCSTKSKSPFIFLCKLMDGYIPQVRDLVTQLKESGESKIVGFVVDMFTTEIMDIANEFELPAYLFYTSGAATLGLWLQMQSLKGEINIDITEYRGSKKEFSISTYTNPVLAKLFPSPMFDKEGLELCLKVSARMIQTKGIMINSFQDLESFALKVLTSDPRTPPVYTVGPLINFTGIDANPPETETIMRWLDNQPTSSVVFLCFGSLGFFDVDQVKEIANAIENSGCRFLWSLRTAPPKDCKQNPGDYESFDEVLPEGFLQRTAGLGKVIGWAPQVQVLGHPAVGGFVTHCGWNSVLESVWFGVPMAAWPMYAEQQMNALQIVKDIGIAVEIKMDYNSDPMMKVIVQADEIENGIRQLIQPESEVKKKVKELMGKTRSAMLKGGSSYISIGSLMEDLLAVH